MVRRPWRSAYRRATSRDHSHLLEATDLPIDRIAADAGFGTATSLRQHLHEALGVTPSAYRSTFGRAVGHGFSM